MIQVHLLLLLLLLLRCQLRLLPIGHRAMSWHYWVLYPEELGQATSSLMLPVSEVGGWTLSTRGGVEPIEAWALARKSQAGNITIERWDCVPKEWAAGQQSDLDPKRECQGGLSGIGNRKATCPGLLEQISPSPSAGAPICELTG